eukprot:6457819-Prymnesium_polylepis.2
MASVQCPVSSVECVVRRLLAVTGIEWECRMDASGLRLRQSPVEFRVEAGALPLATLWLRMILYKYI